MELADVMTQLEAMGNESAKPMLMRHGAREPFFAARIGDLKAIVKQVKKDQQLALALYATGNSDAMYLAGLIADDAAFTKEELQRWAEQAYWSLLSESTVAWVAAGNRHGWELALAWIDSDQEMLAAAGWSTLCGIVAMRPDSELDMTTLARLLERVQSTIHTYPPNRVRYAMNNFVINVAAYVLPLHEQACAVAEDVGVVRVDMGGTACKVPFAPDYIQKMADRGLIGKKRKMVKC
jgi:3-methyladenine DNA glycosylase AlkD